jgi:hypothetical protein
MFDVDMVMRLSGSSSAQLILVLIHAFLAFTRTIRSIQVIVTVILSSRWVIGMTFSWK